MDWNYHRKKIPSNFDKFNSVESFLSSKQKHHFTLQRMKRTTPIVTMPTKRSQETNEIKINWNVSINGRLFVILIRYALVSEPCTAWEHTLRAIERESIRSSVDRVHTSENKRRATSCERAVRRIGVRNRLTYSPREREITKRS